MTILHRLVSPSRFPFHSPLVLFCANRHRSTPTHSTHTDTGADSWAERQHRLAQQRQKCNNSRTFSFTFQLSHSAHFSSLKQITIQRYLCWEARKRESTRQPIPKDLPEDRHSHFFHRNRGTMRNVIQQKSDEHYTSTRTHNAQSFEYVRNARTQPRPASPSMSTERRRDWCASRFAHFQPQDNAVTAPV